MKLKNLFAIILLTCAFALVGCGDDGGSGGQGAGEVCDACDSQALRPACETAYNVCLQEDAGSPEDCAVAALVACGVV